MQTIKHTTYVHLRMKKAWEEDYTEKPYEIALFASDMGGKQHFEQYVCLKPQEIEIEIPDNIEEVLVTGRVENIDKKIEEVRARAELHVRGLEEERARLLSLTHMEIAEEDA